MNAHEYLFSHYLIHNLRAFEEDGNKDDMPIVVYELERIRKCALNRKPRVRLTLVDSDFINTASAVLTLKEAGRYYARYSGSHVDYTGYHVEYTLLVRTDLAEELRDRGLFATVELKKRIRSRGLISKLISIPIRLKDDYDIYEEN